MKLWNDIEFKIIKKQIGCLIKIESLDSEMTANIIKFTEHIKSAFIKFIKEHFKNEFAI